jgi:hypothetical protein
VLGFEVSVNWLPEKRPLLGELFGVLDEVWEKNWGKGYRGF